MNQEPLALVRAWRTSLAGKTPDQILQVFREAIVSAEDRDYSGVVGAVRAFVEGSMTGEKQETTLRQMTGEIGSRHPGPPIVSSVLIAARSRVARLKALFDARAASDAIALVSIELQESLLAEIATRETHLAELQAQPPRELDAVMRFAPSLSDEVDHVGRRIG